MATTPTRRTQADRSAATRAALLDATIDCLIEDGYAGTTTAKVSERAGVSRGAHLHHFQTRAALVAAAVERLARRRGEELGREAAAIPPGRAGRERALDLLWASYASPLFQAALDLWAAGRTDPELRARLVEVERMLDRQTRNLARDLFPDLADRAGFAQMLEMAVSTIRGLALLDTINPGEGRNADQWPFARAVLAARFERL